MIFTSEEMEKNFWNKVGRTENYNECWEWSGAIDKGTGYGKFRFGPADSDVDCAHRIIWKHVYGEPPVDKPSIRHLCNNRKCCNIRHLECGSAWENWMDSVNSGTAKPFKVGHTPWNKGKKMPPEYGERISQGWKNKKAEAHPVLKESTTQE